MTRVFQFKRAANEPVHETGKLRGTTIFVTKLFLREWHPKPLQSLPPNRELGFEKLILP